MDRQSVLKWGAVALVVALVALTVWKWSEWRAAAHAGSAYAARLTCSCRYVEGRSADSCARDIEEDAGFVSLSETPEEKRIDASIPMLGSASAQFKPGYGCLMLPQ